MSDEVEVRARLARLPRPPMPDSVTTAITARLAQEGNVVPLTRSHRSRLNWLVAAAAAVGFVSLIGVTTTSSPAPAGQQPPVVRAGAVYGPADFAQQLRSRMQQGAATAPTATFADTPAGISACTKAIAAYGPVMAVDAGTYADTDAVVLVTRYVANADYEEIWVVEPGCGDGSTVVMRHILVDVG